MTTTPINEHCLASRSRPRSSRALSLLTGVLLLAGCSGASDEATVTASPETTAPAAITTPPVPEEPADTGPETSRTAAPTTTPSSSTTTTLPSDPLRIETTTGPVTGGASEVDGVRHFLSIPFAEAPVGDNAWRPPAPRTAWSDPLDATTVGPSCPQSTGGIGSAFIITPESDPDCLRLSIWAPDEADEFPVMVWLHPGEFKTGSAADRYYTGDNLAEDGVVVVNVNYRLGPQGFLVTDDLREESLDGAVGNYGFLDQQLALEWISANIAAFGGDPNRITIFGESAGGASVCGHLAASTSKGLFHQAIVQSSGGCTGFRPVEVALEEGTALLAELACPDVACVRELPDDAVIAAADSLGLGAGLVADGVTFDTPAFDLADAGELSGLPVLIGSNADEATLFTLGAEEPDVAVLRNYATNFTDDPDVLLDLYPADEYETNLARYQDMLTELEYVCPTLDFASAADSAFVYHYIFVPTEDAVGLGATHGAELSTLFAHVEGLAIDVEWTERREQVATQIQAAWAEFARDGDPGDLFDPYADAGLITVLDTVLEQADTIREGRCEAIAALSPS